MMQRREKITSNFKKNKAVLETRMERNQHNEKNKPVGCFPFAQKIFYVAGIIILTLVMLVEIYNCLIYYGTDPTYVEIKIAPQHKALFPAMTICPQNDGYNEVTLKVFLCISFLSP